MTNPDPGIIDVARDAIRAGRYELLGDIIANEPKLALAAELAGALAAVMRSLGVRRADVSAYSGSTVLHLQADAAQFAAAVLELGVTPKLVNDHWSKEWNQVSATIGGVTVEVSGPHRDKEAK